MLYRKLIKRNAAKVYLYGVVIIALLVSLPAIAKAGTIVFNPAVAVVTIQPGEEKPVKFTPSLADLSSIRSYVSFSLVSRGGEIPAAWISGSGEIYLNGSLPPNEVALDIAVPVGTPAGTYTGTLSPVISRTTERIASSGLALQIEVVDSKTCSEPPIIRDLAAGETIVRSRNHKPLTFTFTGTIQAPENCTTDKAWYSLTDEYGELDASEPIVLGDNGQFSVPVTITASRKGKDKDGRLYTVNFGAENEAGISISETQSIIISHSNRKKHRKKHREK